MSKEKTFNLNYKSLMAKALPLNGDHAKELNLQKLSNKNNLERLVAVS